MVDERYRLAFRTCGHDVYLLHGVRRDLPQSGECEVTRMIGFDPTAWISDAWWSYVLIAVVISASAVFPPLPSESMLVTATGLALASQLDPVLVAVAAGAGSLGGDTVAYLVGRWSVGRRGPRPGGRVEQALAWVQRREGTWLPAMVPAGRFVPGGTTLVGLGCGALRFPVRRFVVLALIGAVVWVGYGFAVATVGEAAAPDNPWLGVGLGVALALALGGCVAAVQWLRNRRRATDRQAVSTTGRSST